jgi:hypothetical protein
MGRPATGEAGGGFNRGVVLGPLVDGEPQPPFVSVAVLEFASPEAALEVLEAIRQVPHDLLTSIPIPRGARTLAADPVVPGAAASLAFAGASKCRGPECAGR